MKSQANTGKNITRRIAKDAVLLAIALIIFIIEAQIPFIPSVPGIKLGLSNVVSLYAMYKLGKSDTLMILLLRILIAGIYTGQAVSILFSLSGGMCCFLVMLALVRFIPVRQAWVTSIFAAIAHNIGQITVAVFILGSVSVLLYLPVLIVSAVVTGAATGLVAQGVMIRMEKIRLS